LYFKREAFNGYFGGKIREARIMKLDAATKKKIVAILKKHGEDIKESIELINLPGECFHNQG